MIRTSLIFHPALHQELLVTAKQEGKSVNKIVEDLITYALDQRKKMKLARMYKHLNALDGAGNKGITDASQKINNSVYGV